MMQLQNLSRWMVFAGCWVAIHGLLDCPALTAAETMARSNIKVMLMFQEGGSTGIQAVEQVLARAFEQHGYSVLDRDIVGQTLRREADVVKGYDIEAAKLLGTRLGATIVVSGKSQTRAQEKTYSSLGDKKVTVSQADVGAKAILASSGKVLVAENAHARKPFDTTGNIALEKAAEDLAGKLIEGIEQFLNRQTIEYRLVVLNIDHPQSLALQDALRRQVQGVQRVSEQGFIENTLELEVSVEKTQDLGFKRTLFAGLSELRVGRFAVVAREAETIYLRRTAEAKPTTGRIGGSTTTPVPPAAAPTDHAPRTERVPIDHTTPRTDPKPDIPSPAASSVAYKPGYRKSWAVVVGINNYQKWPKLDYARKDAEEVIKRLKRLGFDEVIPILDDAATQQRILQVLGDELYAKTETEDRVFVFFAGHGQTQDLPGDNKVGYIIPVDGDDKHYYSTAISMRQLQELSDRLRAKHIFYVLDSCFSGLLLRSMRGEAMADFSAQTTAPARQVLTAGSEGEEVDETEGHGVFTKILLTGLDGSADLNGDGYITASELSQFITPRVLQESQNAQNPIFGRLGSGRGEFVFALK